MWSITTKRQRHAKFEQNLKTLKFWPSELPDQVKVTKSLKENIGKGPKLLISLVTFGSNTPFWYPLPAHTNGFFENLRFLGSHSNCDLVSKQIFLTSFSRKNTFDHTFSNSKVTMVISTIPKNAGWWLVTAIHHPKICWVVTKPSRKNLASEASKQNMGGRQNLNR